MGMSFVTVLAATAAANSTNLPEQVSALDMLTHAEVFFAVSVAILGVLLLIFGFSHHKWITVFNCIALGYLVGGVLGEKVQITTVGAVVGAVVLGSIAWPLMKYAIAICGGLVGAVVGMSIWLYLGEPMSQRWAGALIGLAILGMLSFVLFKASVILFSCIQGGAMVVLGVSALLIKYTPWNQTVHSNLCTRPILMPVLVFAVALLGIILQQQKHGLLESGGGAGGKGAGGGGGDAKKK